MQINHPIGKESRIKDDKFAITHYYSKEDLVNLDNRICYLFNQANRNSLDSISNLSNFNKTYILYYNYNTEVRKEDFLDNSFYKHLILSKRRHNNYLIDEIRYINPEIILEDLDGKFVGVGNALYFNLGINYNDGFINGFQDIIDVKNNLNIVEIFYLSDLNKWELFARDKDGATYVLDSSRKGITVKTLSEFVEEHPEIFK